MKNARMINMKDDKQRVGLEEGGSQAGGYNDIKLIMTMLTTMCSVSRSELQVWVEWC